MKKFLTVLLALALIVCTITVFAACKEDQTPGEEENKVIRISTTTSVNDSGLMAFLKPYFEQDTGYEIQVASAGTGAAINAAKYGNADLILVHSKSQEEAFVTAGFARKVEGQTAERVTFMHNYFVLVGPTADPVNVEDAANVKAAFASIAAAEAKFVSRGDNSGTHTAEVKLWNTTLGITANITSQTVPEAIRSWYISAGQGMGACLTMANQENAYVLTDKATFLSMKNSSEGDKLPNLSILYEQDNDLRNVYSMIAVNPDAPFADATGAALPAGTVTLNTKGADVFITWMMSQRAKDLIKDYGKDSFGEALFYLGAGA